MYGKDYTFEVFFVGLMLSVLFNSYGHVRMVSSSSHIFFLDLVD